jgi:hypothetical protein
VIGSDADGAYLDRLVAGGLAVINPAGPAAASLPLFYLGADERQLPSAPTRVLQACLLASGHGRLPRLLRPPCQSATASARSHGPSPGPGSRPAPRSRSPACSHCSADTSACRRSCECSRGASADSGRCCCSGTATALPHSAARCRSSYLTLVGASLSRGKLTTFLAYGAGMAIVLMALSVLVALAREGASRAARPLLPHMSRIAGLSPARLRRLPLLLLGTSALRRHTAADDPMVSFVVRFSGQARDLAAHARRRLARPGTRTCSTTRKSSASGTAPGSPAARSPTTPPVASAGPATSSGTPTSPSRQERLLAERAERRARRRQRHHRQHQRTRAALHPATRQS